MSECFSVSGAWPELGSLHCSVGSGHTRTSEGQRGSNSGPLVTIGIGTNEL